MTVISRTNPRPARRRLRLPGILAAGCLIFVLSVQTGAAAQDPTSCSSKVVDTSGRLDIETVEAALVRVDPRATVIVRGFDSTASGNVQTEVDAIVAECFAGTGGSIRDDVIMLSFSVLDRQSDVWIGADWAAAVPDPDVLREDVMGGPISESDFTGGIVDAIDRIGAGVASVAPAVDSDEGSATSEEASDSPGPSRWPLIAGFVLLAGGIGVAMLVRRQARLRSVREDLDKAMAGPIVRAGALRERTDRTEASVEMWLETVEGETETRLLGLRAEAADSGRAVERGSSLLSQALPNGVEGASIDQIERAQERLNELSRSIDSHDEVLDRVLAFGAHLDHLRVAVAAKRDLLLDETDPALALVETRRTEGWTVGTASRDILSVKADLLRMSFKELKYDWLALSEQVESAEAGLFAAEHRLQSLPEREASLERWASELTATREVEASRADYLRRRFQSMVTSHASDSWQWAFGHPDQALTELAQVDEAVSAVVDRLLPAKDLDEASNLLETGGLHLVVADDLLDQVDDLFVDLEQAELEAPGILAQGRSILAEASAFISRHGADLDHDYGARPGEFGRALQELELELRQLKPNHLRVAQVGERMNRQMDELLTQAKDDKATMEANRREAEREVARAGRALLRARRSLGWELAGSRDGDDLDRLDAALEDLPDDPARRAEKAAQIAEAALTIQERIIARRRRHGNWIVIGDGPGGWGPDGGFAGGLGGAGRPGRGFGGLGGSSGAGHTFGTFGGGGGRSFGGGRSSGSF